MRHETFLEKYPSFQDIFSKLINGDQSTFNKLEVDVDIMHRISSTRVLQCIMLIVLDQDCTYSKQLLTCYNILFSTCQYLDVDVAVLYISP